MSDVEAAAVPDPAPLAAEAPAAALFPEGVLDAALLLLAADAEFVPPLQAAARTMIETRTDRYIFPSCCQR